MNTRKKKKLMEQAEIYKQTFHLLARMTPGLLQKVEEKDTSESEHCHMKNLLIKAILCQLKQNVRQHVEQECYGCRINHPSQKQHDMCLWTTPWKPVMSRSGKSGTTGRSSWQGVRQ